MKTKSLTTSKYLTDEGRYVVLFLYMHAVTRNTKWSIETFETLAEARLEARRRGGFLPLVAYNSLAELRKRIAV